MKTRPWILPAALGAVVGVASTADFAATIAVVGTCFLVALAWRIRRGGWRDCLRWRARGTPR